MNGAGKGSTGDNAEAHHLDPGAVPGSSTSRTLKTTQSTGYVWRMPRDIRQIPAKGKTMYRQGDVLLVKASKPEGGKVVKSRIIAEGEATGHHHRFNDCAEVVTIGDVMWVVAGEGAELTHQEHDTITVEPGTYRVIHQREYTPERIRRVVD